MQWKARVDCPLRSRTDIRIRPFCAQSGLWSVPPNPDGATQQLTALWAWRPRLAAVDAVERFEDLPDFVRGEAVVDLLAVAAGLHQPPGAQLGQVLR